MENLPRLVRPSGMAIEVGGHIGYLSIHLAHLVGRGGRVRAFDGDMRPFGPDADIGPNRFLIPEEAVSDI